jgi:hypothetical protein
MIWVRRGAWCALAALLALSSSLRAVAADLAFPGTGTTHAHILGWDADIRSEVFEIESRPQFGPESYLLYRVVDRATSCVMSRDWRRLRCQTESPATPTEWFRIRAGRMNADEAVVWSEWSYEINRIECLSTSECEVLFEGNP